MMMVPLKILLHETWRTKLEWDDAVNDDIHEKWLKWVELMTHLPEIKIPRHYGLLRIHESSVEVHVMVDASEIAYAALAYIRFGDASNVRCSLIGSKCRTAPQKPLSIPRMELMAAVLGARYLKSLIEAHTFKVNATYFWTDSRTVIRWLRSDARRYKQFVALRVGEILEMTNVNDWRWLPSGENVADEATKVKEIRDFSMIADKWFNGPTFLRKSKTDWPNEDEFEDVLPEETELKLQASHGEVVFMKPITPEPTRFFHWHRLLRVQAWVNRGLNAFQSKHRCHSVTLDDEEIKLAAFDLYRKAQWDDFTSEMKILSSNSQIIDRKNQLYQLSPYLDERGVLRMRGRIDQSDHASLDTKRPVILPRDHYITRLIVLRYHRLYLHRNHETVINEIRQRFVITRLRQLLNSVRRICQYCKNQSAVPNAPEMAELPKIRMSAYTRPFTNTGTDCFGPIAVRVGRRIEKRWGMMFTCLTVRAIHIELINSLSTDSCILAIRCFIARRGCPSKIISDNGTNYRGANNELLRCLRFIDTVKIRESFCNIKWTFLPPHSPHMGGAWERMIRAIKSNLQEVLSTHHPTEETLRCVFAEVEMIINSHPLTDIPIDPHEREALTPNHFLIGDSGGMMIMNESKTTDDLRKSWKYSQLIANQYWRRWLREYLPFLTRRTKWHDNTPPIKPGDIVIVCDDQNTRNYWPKGIVIDVNKDKHGQVRSAIVKTAAGIYTRPTVKLAVLDVLEQNINLTDGQIARGQNVGDRS